MLKYSDVILCVFFWNNKKAKKVHIFEVFIVNCSGANVSIKVQSFFFVDDIFFSFLSTWYSTLKVKYSQTISSGCNLFIKPMKNCPVYGHLKIPVIWFVCFHFMSVGWKMYGDFSLVFGQLLLKRYALRLVDL